MENTFVNVVNSCTESIKNIGSLTLIFAHKSQSYMEPDGSVSNKHLCFLINVKDRKAIRLAHIKLSKWESASWQNITSTEIVKYGLAVQSLYYFFLCI
jgi:hypothetical protein